jgi:hypothetical protein
MLIPPASFRKSCVPRRGGHSAADEIDHLRILGHGIVEEVIVHTPQMFVEERGDGVLGSSLSFTDCLVIQNESVATL